MSKFISIDDVLAIMADRGLQLTAADLESQPTTRRFVVLQGEPAETAAISTSTDENGNEILTIS